jgi:hypothetical protein
MKTSSIDSSRIIRPFAENGNTFEALRSGTGAKDVRMWSSYQTNVLLG